jgi:hypothetical protein
MNIVRCTFKNICVNYKEKCDKCKFNENIKLKNYLKMKKDNQSIRYLENMNE